MKHVSDGTPHSLLILFFIHFLGMLCVVCGMMFPHNFRLFSANNSKSTAFDVIHHRSAFTFRMKIHATKVLDSIWYGIGQNATTMLPVLCGA